jgi:hypothetical protein
MEPLEGTEEKIDAHHFWRIKAHDNFRYDEEQGAAGGR